MNNENSIQDMCRTCMRLFSKTKKKAIKKQSIQDVPNERKNTASIKEMLQVVQPQIKVDIEDNLPTSMCSNCIEKLVVSHDFIEMYKNVHQKFRKMLMEIDVGSYNYDFKEVDETLEDFDEDVRAVETKYELEIEKVNIDGFEKDKKNNVDFEEFEDEPFQALSDDSENKQPFFLNPYSDASDNECTSHISWKEQEVTDDTANSSTSQKNKENTEKILLPLKNDDGSIPCQQCESVFDDDKLWQEHMHQHLSEKKPKRKYKKNSNMPNNTQSKKKPYECELCGKGFVSSSYYNNHKKRHTRKIKMDDESSYLCIECGKSFKNVGSLNTHMLRHKGEKTFQCAHCPKRFVCASGLYGHMMVHTKVKPYVCDICGSAFHMAYQLRKHNLYHNGIKNYQCEYCDMRFVTREKQMRHMRTHTGEKPYRCKYCERAFAQSNDCVKHLRQHLGDNVYQCELCPLRFPLARDLRVHFATHKDDDEETRARNLEARREEERNLQIKLGCKERK